MAQNMEGPGETFWDVLHGPHLPPALFAVKYDPPRVPIAVSKRAGRLLAQWVAPAGQDDARVQFRQRPTGGSWVLVSSSPGPSPGSLSLPPCSRVTLGCPAG